MNVSYEWSNLGSVLAGFNRIERGLESLKPLWGEFQEQFQKDERDLFAAAPWPPLSERYAEQKRRQFGNKPLLRATDALFESLTEAGAEGSVRRIDDLQAEFGTSVEYAPFHQLGTSRMPARPPLIEPEEKTYSTIAGRYMESLIESAGFN